MKQMYVIGNWKMNGSRVMARELANGLASDPIISEAVSHGVVVAVCPPAPYLTDVFDVLHKTSVILGAQDCHHRQRGAHTGDVSPAMLLDSGCSHVILGHSERRQGHGETDDLIAAKVIAALEGGLRPIVCVGETLDQHQQQRTVDIVCAQVKIVLDAIESRIADVIIAYEPVWAIGTGLAATVDHVSMAHAAIADTLGSAGSGVPILYGGSVTADNAGSLFACHHVHGGLIGGASLQVSSFSAIVYAARLASEGQH